ncbi:Acetyltransferase family protein [Candidatus Desulfosporosinus infrequens]|uniref:Acetyltransferase family protein n=1 Tax=Candidatus Desulfosporosinus infrequens TaxID=2043169 RepID=A0A2U3KCQ3_9FIRM|nr:Acetyltransferase family protein [Candidatus Desulfosporosinus infrequens]
MRNIRVTTLEHISLEELTNIWNRCWRGYYYDMTYTPENIRTWLHLSQVFLQHSVAIMVEDQVAGFALLSVDGSDGWVAGTCIAPSYRRKGLFTPLMHSLLNSATCVGVKRVYLEVLIQNHALKVYQSVGFMRLRQLNIYRNQCRTHYPPIRKPAVRPLERVTDEEYFENRRGVLFNPAWQRREGYLKRHVHSLAVMNSTGTAGALFAGVKNTICLDAWSVTETGAEEVISSVFRRTGTSFTLINQPKDWIVACLRAEGIIPSAKQFEMCLELT